VDAEIYFICGTDAFLSIEGWLEAEAIIKSFPIIVGARPRYKDRARDVMIRRLTNDYQARIQKIHMPKIDISSSDIKCRVMEGKSIKYLVPEAVEDYIKEKELYRKLV
jgi:nicotinate-nucleotide adenylyltransferase